MFSLVSSLPFLIGSLAGQTPAGQSPPVSLQSAVESGKVEASFAGTGASSGDAVFLRVRKVPTAGTAPLVLIVPPGSILRSLDPSAQSMVVSGIHTITSRDGSTRQTSQITLSGVAEVGAVLSSYCIDFQKENPSVYTGFRLEKSDPFLACIMRQGRDLSTEGVQAAVWIYTDAVNYDEMKRKFPVKVSDWVAAGVLVQRCRLALEPSQRDASAVNRVTRVVPPATSQPLQASDAIAAGLKSVTGDLGVQSGPVATNAAELAALERLGQRDYWEFEISLGAQPAKLAEATVTLLSANAVTNRYSLQITVDDKSTLKRNKAANDPVQFYTANGGNVPYEIVVNRVTSSGISGYMAVPKPKDHNPKIY